MEKITYSQALAELQKILEEIESQKVDVDVLTAKMRRASFLIRWCQDRLKKTETEVTKILTDLQSRPEEAPPEK